MSRAGPERPTPPALGGAGGAKVEQESEEHNHDSTAHQQQENLFDWTPTPRFDGPDISEPDAIRMGRQLDAVYRTLLRHRDSWLTFVEIQHELLKRYAIFASETSVSARLRDLRKQRYGSHVVSCRRRNGGAQREYQLEAKP